MGVEQGFMENCTHRLISYRSSIGSGCFSWKEVCHMTMIKKPVFYQCRASSAPATNPPENMVLVLSKHFPISPKTFLPQFTQLD